MFHLTLGYCLENSSASVFGSGNPVSKYPLKVIGAVPQVAAFATAPLLTAWVEVEGLPPGPPRLPAWVESWEPPPGRPQAGAARIPPTASTARAPLRRPVRDRCDVR